MVAPQPRQGGPPHPLAVRRIVTEWAAAPAEVRQPRTEGPLVRQSPEACGGEPRRSPAARRPRDAARSI